MTALLTAAVVLLVLAVASRTPGQRTISSEAHHRGVTASQIAHGTWSTIAALPRPQCGGSLLSTGHDALLLTSDAGPRCANAAAVYDPATNVWTELDAPPTTMRSGEWTAAWNGTQAVVVANDGAVAELDPTADRWTMLPATSVPVGGASVVADPTQAVIMGHLASSGTAVSFSWDGARWTRLPDLDVPFVATPYLDPSGLWAFATRGTGEDEYVNVYRLDQGRWMTQPRPGKLPYVVQTVTEFEGSQLITGQDCPAGSFCTITRDEHLPVLIHLGTTSGTRLPSSPFTADFETILAAGQTVIGIDGTTAFAPEPLGSVAAYDPAAKRWLAAPQPPRIQIETATWTTSGLIEIGALNNACHCDGGGAILRPGP